MVANNNRDLNSYCLIDWKVRNDEIYDDDTMDEQVDVTIYTHVYNLFFVATVVVINSTVIVLDIPFSRLKLSWLD